MGESDVPSEKPSSFLGMAGGVCRIEVSGMAGLGDFDGARKLIEVEVEAGKIKIKIK